MQEDVAKTYVSLLPDLSYMGHNMVRDLDPEVSRLLFIDSGNIDQAPNSSSNFTTLASTRI